VGAASGLADTAEAKRLPDHCGDVRDAEAEDGGRREPASSSSGEVRGAVPPTLAAGQLRVAPRSDARTACGIGRERPQPRELLSREVAHVV
jgi:hypothetical protein